MKLSLIFFGLALVVGVSINSFADGFTCRGQGPQYQQLYVGIGNSTATIYTRNPSNGATQIMGSYESVIPRSLYGWTAFDSTDGKFRFYLNQVSAVLANGKNLIFICK